MEWIKLAVVPYQAAIIFLGRRLLHEISWLRNFMER